MMNIILVAIGGGLGAVLRYLLSKWTHALVQPGHFPVGTLAVNIAGCAAIGLLSGWLFHAGAEREGARMFLCVGVLGGFTTYSAFGLETVTLMRDGHHGAALLYVGAHLAACLGAVALGMLVGSRLAY